MADQEVTVELGVDDKELFQGAMAEPTAEPEVKEERPRDELGRFTEKTEEAEPAKAEEAKPEVKAEVKPEAKVEPEKDDQAQVPSWRLREIREAREASDKRAEEAERRSWQFQQELQTIRSQLEQAKPKPEPVNWFENPDQALRQNLSPIEAQMAEMRNEMRLMSSRALAVATHGVQAVSDMEIAVEKAMQSNHPEIGMLRNQMLQSSDPVGVAINWHKRSKLMELTGGDPDAYEKQVREKLLKDPEFQKQIIATVRGQVEPGPAVKLPPSLSRTTGSGASSETPGDDDMSDRALFKDAVNAPRRGRK